MHYFLKYISQLILAPGPGWEDISKAGSDVKWLLLYGFYPLMALTVLSSLMDFCYHDITVGEFFHGALVIVAKYFLTYYFAVFMYSMFLHKYIVGTQNEKRNSTFVLYILSILMLIEFLANFFPTDVPLIQLFPLYLVIIIWRGARYMAVVEAKMWHFIGLSVAAMILPTYLIPSLFNAMFPN